jgi:hypothetical protein
MRRSKVVRISFARGSDSVAVASGGCEVLLQDVHAISHGTVEAFWELAIRITGFGISNLEVGKGDRRDSGGAKGESNDGAGVHIGHLKLIHRLF